MAYINPYHLFIGSFIPNWLLSHKIIEISQGAKLCYARLCQYAGNNGIAYPKMTTLAKELGVEVRQTRKYISELEELKLIERDINGHNGGSNKYKFLLHEWMGGMIIPGERHNNAGEGGTIMPPKENHLRESNKKNILCDRSHETIKPPFDSIKKPCFDSYPEKFPFKDYLEVKELVPPTDKQVLTQLAEVALYHFNLLCRTRFRPVDANLALIRKCLATGATLQNCFEINARKKGEWMHDKTMKQYLRPKTLYALTNFEQYLGEIKTLEKEYNDN